MARKPTPYQGGAWSVGGLLTRHQLPDAPSAAEVRDRRDQVAAQLAYAQHRATEGLPVYARIAAVLRVDLTALEQQLEHVVTAAAVAQAAA